MQKRDAIRKIEKSGCTYDWDGPCLVIIAPDPLKFSCDTHLISCGNADNWISKSAYYQYAIDHLNDSLPLTSCLDPVCDTCYPIN